MGYDWNGSMNAYENDKATWNKPFDENDENILARYNQARGEVRGATFRDGLVPTVKQAQWRGSCGTDQDGS